MRSTRSRTGPGRPSRAATPRASRWRSCTAASSSTCSYRRAFWTARAARWASAVRSRWSVVPKAAGCGDRAVNTPNRSAPSRSGTAKIERTPNSPFTARVLPGHPRVKEDVVDRDCFAAHRRKSHDIRGRQLGQAMVEREADALRGPRVEPLAGGVPDGDRGRAGAHQLDGRLDQRLQHVVEPQGAVEQLVRRQRPQLARPCLNPLLQVLLGFDLRIDVPRVEHDRAHGRLVEQVSGRALQPAPAPAVKPRAIADCTSMPWIGQQVREHRLETASFRRMDELADTPPTRSAGVYPITLVLDGLKGSSRCPRGRAAR